MGSAVQNSLALPVSLPPCNPAVDSLGHQVNDYYLSDITVDYSLGVGWPRLPFTFLPRSDFCFRTDSSSISASLTLTTTAT